MEFRFTLSENDYLQHQLYADSRSGRIKRRRRNSWLTLTLLCFGVGLVFWLEENNFLAVYCLVCGILILCFYPMYQNRVFKKHYKRYIAETYKYRFNETVEIVFADNFVEMKSALTEAKLYFPVIESIAEVSNYFYLKIKTGGDVIIPKSAMENIDTVREELKTLAQKLSVDFISDVNWKWR